MIEKTKRLVEERYTKANGYEHDAQVIYGDTDSVMVKFGDMDLAKVMELSGEAAARITEQFERPINLEFEKVYFPYLLVGKKRYVGLYWTNPNAPDKVDKKGIETERRDRCGLVQKTLEECLDALLRYREVERSIGIVHRALRDLFQHKTDISLLVNTGGWGKARYVSDPPAVAVAKKMMTRDPNVTYGPGDRIPYVIVKGGKKSKVSDRAEDPGYAKTNDLAFDVEYYFERLRGPLNAIFESILGGIENVDARLFTGDHMARTGKIRAVLPSCFTKAGFTKERRKER
jgi:DNA polymerase delta subunit 1